MVAKPCAMPTPIARSSPRLLQPSREAADLALHRERHARRARCAGSATGTGSLKNTIMPSPVKRSSVPSCSRTSAPHRRVVLAERAHQLLGLGGLGERGEAAQVEEDDDDLAPVALQRVLGAAGDDQLGELRREEALQPADPLELRDPLGDALLERAVQLRELAAWRSSSS